MNSTNNSDYNPSQNSNMLTYYYLGMSFAFIFLMMFIALVSCYCNHRNWQNWFLSSGSNSNRTVILMERDHTELNIEVCAEEQDAILNSYPILLYSQVKLHKADSTSLTCSICLGDYKDSEWLRLLSDCGHFFHKECVATWFRLNHSCPMCRSSALPTPIAQVTPLSTTHD